MFCHWILWHFSEATRTDFTMFMFTDEDWCSSGDELPEVAQMPGQHQSPWTLAPTYLWSRAMPSYGHTAIPVRCDMAASFQEVGHYKLFNSLRKQQGPNVYDLLHGKRESPNIDVWRCISCKYSSTIYALNQWVQPGSMHTIYYFPFFPSVALSTGMWEKW